MTYVDGFVLPVRTAKLPAYRRMARAAGKIWVEHGALEFVECVGDDLTPSTPDGSKMRRFPEMAGARRGESVLFSFIVYKSRAHRDRVNRKAMRDPRLAKSMLADSPFDPARMAWGGFRSIVEWRGEAGR